MQPITFACRCRCGCKARIVASRYAELECDACRAGMHPRVDCPAPEREP